MKLAYKDTFLYKWASTMYKKHTVLKDPTIEIRRAYKKRFGREPDLNNPKDLVEKIYWMELYADTTMWTVCEDKYKMRGFLEDRGLRDYLPKLYGKWDSVGDFAEDYDVLPSSFVLKLNNGCGTVKVIKNKSEHSQKELCKLLKKWLAIPYGYSNSGLHYLFIEPCIMAEELLSNSNEDISPNSLIDYKLWCFDGTPEMFFIAYGRTHDSVGATAMDLNWQEMPEKVREEGQKFNHAKKINIPRPKCLAEMLKIARNVSSGFPQMRVDFYVVDDRPVIGELTLASGYSALTEECYSYLGSKIDLSKVKLAPVPNIEKLRNKLSKRD